MNKTRFLTLTTLIFFLISAFLGLSLWKCMKTNRDLAEKSPFITSNEKIENFTLTGVDESNVTLEDLKMQSRSLVFIFARPCTPCNQNIIFWNKIAQILKGSVKIYGIILSDLTEAYNFSKKTNLEFTIYVPDDLAPFKKSWKIRSDQAETILMRYDRPATTIIGPLDAGDTAAIIKKAREIE